MSQASQLMYADGGGDIGEVVFVAKCHDFIGPVGPCTLVSLENVSIDAVATHDLNAPDEFTIARDNHTTFAGCQWLVGIEAKDGRIGVERAYLPFPISRRERMRGVL